MVEEPRDVGPRVELAPELVADRGPRVELAHSTAQGKTIHFNTFNAFLLHVVEPEIVAPKLIANTCMDYLLAPDTWVSRRKMKLKCLDWKEMTRSW